MDKKQTLEMIAAISNANGAPGFEDEAARIILSYAGGLGQAEMDRMRNVYIRRRENTGNRPVVQLDAHSDEVGFMVQAICPNGTLRIAPLGGWVSHNVPAHKFWVRNRDGEYISGITASTPPHSSAPRPGGHRWRSPTSPWTWAQRPGRRRWRSSACASGSRWCRT